MLKWIAVALAAVGIISGLSYVAIKQANKINQLRAEVVELNAQADELRARSAKAATVRDASDLHRQDLREAATATEWGAVSVPVDVTGKLCEFAQCRASEVPAPDT